MLNKNTPSSVRKSAMLGMVLMVLNHGALAGSSETGTATINNAYGTLELRSTAGNSVAVVVSTPQSFWSYAAGDLIISASGIRVHTPEDLFSVLRATTAAIVDSVVIRNNDTVIVVLNVDNYRISMPPPPPMPPTPPGR